MAKHVEKLTNDRNKLSVDLADKTLTIKKLLEDNTMLNKNLNGAQHEATTLLRDIKNVRERS